MRQLFNVLLAGIAFSATVLPCWAEDLKLEARLILGANNDPEVVKYEPVDPQLSDKLHHTFKWKNYFEITNNSAQIPLNQSRDLKMSETCSIRVKNVGASRVEVYCIGHGKQVHKGAYTLEPPQWLVLCGSCTNDTAWFVGLRAVDSKAVDPKKAVSKN